MIKDMREHMLSFISYSEMDIQANLLHRLREIDWNIGSPQITVD